MAWVLKAICSGCRKTFQTMSEPERHQICFLTPSTICCGGVAVDYISVLMIINEHRLLSVWRIDVHLLNVHFLFSLSDDRLVTFHHPVTFPFYSCVKWYHWSLQDPLTKLRMFDQSINLLPYVKYGSMYCDTISETEMKRNMEAVVMCACEITCTICMTSALILHAFHFHFIQHELNAYKGAEPKCLWEITISIYRKVLWNGNTCETHKGNSGVL